MIEKPTRNASALTVRLLFPLSLIRNTSADPRLAIIRIKATATKIFMVWISGQKKQREPRESTGLKKETL